MHHGQQLPTHLSEEARALDLGATGVFANGRLCQSDAGGIRFDVHGDPSLGLVVVNYGTPLSWLALSPADTRKLADLLYAAAGEMDGQQYRHIPIEEADT